MPDIPLRAQYEKKLATIVGDRINGARQKILDGLGDPPNPDNIPQSVWDEIGVDMAAEIKPQLEQVFAESAAFLGNDIANKFDVTVRNVVDWNMINTRAATWSKQHAGDLVKDINQTSREKVNVAVGNFFEKQQTMDDLRQQLEDDFGPVRAAMIASTEVTRASVEGENDIVDEIESNSDLKMIATWNTENDDWVCDICDPRNQTTAEDGDWEGDEPPTHPNCRCWLNWAPEGW